MKNLNKGGKMKVSKEQKALNKYEKRFNSFMIKLNEDINKDPNLINHTKKWNVFAGICVMMRKDITSFLKYARK